MIWGCGTDLTKSRVHYLGYSLEEQIIRPSIISRTLLSKFYELAMGDLANLMLPKTLVFCEGNARGIKRKNYDKEIYTLIFEREHSEAYFISGGSCTEIENVESTYGDVMNCILSNTTIIKIVDLDDRSNNEIQDLKKKGIRTLSKRHLEAYLLDDDVIKKLCERKGKPEKYNECIDCKQKAIADSVQRGNPIDDIKSASGEIYVGLKRILELTQCGNTADTFLRDTMAPLLSSDMPIYKQLEKDIFGEY